MNDGFKILPTIKVRPKRTWLYTQETKGRFLVFTEKHGTRYFDASTDDLMTDAMLKVIKERLKDDYWYSSDRIKIFIVDFSYIDKTTKQEVVCQKKIVDEHDVNTTEEAKIKTKMENIKHDITIKNIVETDDGPPARVSLDIMYDRGNYPICNNTKNNSGKNWCYV